MKAMILAAGKGTRVRPLTYDLPKPMIPILGKPVMAYLVEHLARYGVTEIMVNVSYLHEKIEEYFGEGHQFAPSTATSHRLIVISPRLSIAAGRRANRPSRSPSVSMAASSSRGFGAQPAARCSQVGDQPAGIRKQCNGIGSQYLEALHRSESDRSATSPHDGRASRPHAFLGNRPAAFARRERGLMRW